MTFLLVSLFLAIVGVTAWGWVSLGSDQRFKVSLGVPPSVEGTSGKKTWLLMNLAAGAVVFVSSLTLGSKDDVSLSAIGAALLAFFLLQEYLGIRRAKSVSGRFPR